MLFNRGHYPANFSVQPLEDRIEVARIEHVRGCNFRSVIRKQEGAFLFHRSPAKSQPFKGGALVAAHGQVAYPTLKIRDQLRIVKGGETYSSFA